MGRELSRERSSRQCYGEFHYTHTQSPDGIPERRAKVFFLSPDKDRDVIHIRGGKNTEWTAVKCTNEPYKKGLNKHEKERDAGRDFVSTTKQTRIHISPEGLIRI